MSVESLAALLARRLNEAGRAGDDSVSVAELHRTLLPYHVCRGSLGYATKAEYDLEMLELLSSDRYLLPAEGELRAAVSDERASAEPGLGFLKNFAAAKLEIRSELEDALDVGWQEHLPASYSESAVEASSEPELALGIAAAETGATSTERGRVDAVCWKCRRELPSRPDLRFCVFCGADQERPCCAACGEELDAGWAFCPTCGKGVSAGTAKP